MLGYNHAQYYSKADTPHREQSWLYARVSLNGSEKVGTVHRVRILRSVAHLDVIWDGDTGNHETTSEYVIRTGDYDYPPF
mgnify:CR=1 FL=1